MLTGYSVLWGHVQVTASTFGLSVLPHLQFLLKISDGRTSNYGSMFVRFETFDNHLVRSRFDKKSSNG